MTALLGPPPRAGRFARMMAPMAAEVMPVRPYPLDATTWAPAIFTEALSIFRVIGIAVPPFVDMFVMEDDGVIVRTREFPLRRLSPAVLLAPFRLMVTSRRYNPDGWQDDPDLKSAIERVHALGQRNLQMLSWEELLDMAREATGLVRPLAGEPRLRYYPRGMLAIARLRLLLEVARGGKKHFGSLLSGIDTKTTETNRVLEALAARIRSDPVLSEIIVSTHDSSDRWAALERQPSGRTFLTELQVFLDRYGHREGSPALVSLPTWNDRPETVLGILKGLAAAQPRRTGEKQVWEVARNELLAHSLLRFRPLRPAFLTSLARARQFLQVREDTHFYGTMPIAPLRKTFLELGRRLVKAGALDDPEEVFHLTLSDLERIKGAWPPPLPLVDELRRTVQRRKGRRDALKDTPLIDPRLFQRSEKGTDALLRGVPGSPGLTEGQVRIVHDGSEFGKLRPGEVLVAPYTNPSWTPLFQSAIAVVVDSGAAGSHAAIVAREYGIPAVMGTIDGTRRLVDGERIRVDGSQGLVFRATGRPVGLTVEGYK